MNNRVLLRRMYLQSSGIQSFSLYPVPRITMKKRKAELPILNVKILPVPLLDMLFHSRGMGIRE